jgi:serine/threonine protein kinase
VQRYAAQALGALLELHALGVVMGDLKPANLLLDAELDELVVTDFGASNVMMSHGGDVAGSSGQGVAGAAAAAVAAGGVGAAAVGGAGGQQQAAGGSCGTPWYM